jgi:CheY-like chemotaxis protein
MADKIRLLVACSDPESRAHLTDSLKDTEFETILASNCEESSRVLGKQPVSMVFCEDRLPGGGLPGVLNEVKLSGTSTPVVVLSRTGDWEEYLAALRLGAFDMVTPPYQRTAIHTVAYNALHESRVSRGARDVEALPHMVPRGALRAAVGAARAAANASQGPAPRASQNEYRPVRKEAAGSLPGTEKSGMGEEKLSTSKSLTNVQSAAASGEAPLGNHETDASVSKKKGG